MDLSGSPTTTAPPRWRRGRRLLGALALALVAFAAGRLSAQQAVTAETVSPPVSPALHTRTAHPGLERVQQQAPDDPRELIPLPGPGQQPGQQPGPGQTGECPLFLYQDGQLFRFDAPGGQPGGQPGQGGGSPELFPLQPVPPPGQPLPVPPRQEEPPLDLVRSDRHTTLLARR